MLVCRSIPSFCHARHPYHLSSSGLPPSLPPFLPFPLLPSFLAVRPRVTCRVQVWGWGATSSRLLADWASRSLPCPPSKWRSRVAALLPTPGQPLASPWGACSACFRFSSMIRTTVSPSARWFFISPPRSSFLPLSPASLHVCQPAWLPRSHVVALSFLLSLTPPLPLSSVRR